MQALTLLARRLTEGCPPMHTLRLRVLLAATSALMQHPQLGISALGSALSGATCAKHRIKRIDRLIGNRHLCQERVTIYGVLCRWLLAGQAEPVIVVDWSDATPDRQWQLLRAALAAPKALAPSARMAEQISGLYRRCLQIEEGFRNLKSPQYSLGLARPRATARRVSPTCCSWRCWHYCCCG